MRMFFAVALSVLLAGCATSYQPQSFSGGYSETRLGENLFQISFSGNGYTSRERVADFNLLRSAELTIEYGFRYFVIVNTEKNSDVSAYTTPSSSHTTGSAYGSGKYAYGSATTTTYGGQTYFISKPSATNMILCFKEKPAMEVLTFDAVFVAKSIRDKYGITQATMTPVNQTAYEAEKARIAKEVDDFADDPAHSYFNEVADEVIRLIKGGMSLQDAYDQASKNCTTQTIGAQIVKKCP